MSSKQHDKYKNFSHIRQEYDNDQDREAIYYHADRRNETHKKTSFFKDASLYGVIFTVLMQSMGAIWWAASVSVRIDTLTDAQNAAAADNYLKSQAASDQMNLQIQIETNRNAIERGLQDLDRTKQEIKDLYSKYYSIPHK